MLKDFRQKTKNRSSKKTALFLGLIVLASLVSLEAFAVNFQTIRQTSSMSEMQSLLKKVTQEVESLLTQADPDFKNHQTALKKVDLVANRTHDLSSWKKEEKGKATDIFRQTVALFQQISETNMLVMERIQSETGGDEQALDTLYASKHWKQKEFISSLSRYRISKARYYLALVLEGRQEEQTKLLREALVGFSPYTMAYQGPDLIRYCHLGRALCYRELGKYEDASKELEEASRGEVKPSFLFRVRTERARIHLQFQRYREVITTVDQLLIELGNQETQSGLANRIKLLKLESLLSLVDRRLDQQATSPVMEEPPNRALTQDPTKGGIEESLPYESETYHQQAVKIMRQLMKEGKSLRDRVSSLVLQELGSLKETKGIKLSPLERWILAESFFEKKQYQEALPLYSLVLESTEPEDKVYLGKASLQIGFCLYNLKQFEKAGQYFTSFLSQTPDSPEAASTAYWRYQAYKNISGNSWPPQYLEAIQYYLMRFPSHHFASAARYQLGQYYRRKGEQLRAAEELSRVAEDFRYIVDARLLAFRSYVEELEKLKRKDKKSTNAQELYAKALRTKELFKTALNGKFQSIPDEKEKASLDKSSAFAALLSARLYTSGPTQNYARAFEEIKDFDLFYPQQRELFLPASLLMIGSLQGLNRIEEAGKAVEQLIRDYGNHPKSGQIYNQLTQQFQAKAQILQAQRKKEAAQGCKRIVQMLKSAKIGESGTAVPGTAVPGP